MPFRSSRLSCATVLALSAASSAQPLTPQATSALDARDWQALRNQLQPAGAKATGETAYWLAISLCHTGDRKNGAKALVKLWKEAPADKALTIAMLEHAELKDIQDTSIGDVVLLPIDHEVCEAFIRAKMRLVQFALSQGTSTWASAAYFICGDVFDAYERYVAVTPRRDPEIVRWVGFAARYRNNAAALTLLNEAAAALPPSWDIELDRAIALLQAGDEAGARAAYARARELAPAVATNPQGGQSRRVDCALGWGQALYDLGRHQEAAAAFREAIVLQPAISAGRHRLGLALYAAGDLPTAIAAFTDSLRVEHRTETVTCLGRCWLDLGEYPTAQTILSEALASFKDGKEKPPADLAYDLGRACWGAGDRPQAIKHLEAAFAADTHNLPRARWLLQAHLAMEDPYAAIDVARRYGSMRARNHNAIREEAIAEILKRFPLPMPGDRARGRSMPHTILAQTVRIQAAFTGLNFSESLEHMKTLGLLAPNRANHIAAWALLQTGDITGAEKAAAGAIKNSGANESLRDESRLCHGVILLVQNQPARAMEALAPITAKEVVARRDVALLYATLAAGKQPDPRLLTAYNTLGVIESPEDRARSTEVFVILPGSPLLELSEKLQPGDQIRIELDELTGQRIHTPATAPALRGRAVLNIWRTAEFRVTADFSPLAAKLPPAPEGSATGKKP